MLIWRDLRPIYTVFAAHRVPVDVRVWWRVRLSLSCRGLNRLLGTHGIELVTVVEMAEIVDLDVHLPLWSRGRGQGKLLLARPTIVSLILLAWAHKIKYVLLFRALRRLEDPRQFQIQLLQLILLNPLLVELLLKRMVAAVSLIDLLPKELDVELELRRVVVPLVVLDWVGGPLRLLLRCLGRRLLFLALAQ